MSICQGPWGRVRVLVIACVCTAAFVIILRMANTVQASVALANSSFSLEYRFYRGLLSLQQGIRLVDAGGAEIASSSTENVWKTGAANAIVYRHANQPVYFVQLLEGFYEIQLQPPTITNICILGADVAVKYVGTFEVQKPHDNRGSWPFQVPLEVEFKNIQSDARHNAHDGNNRCF
jgi:hypothetical protein